MKRNTAVVIQGTGVNIRQRDRSSWLKKPVFWVIKKKERKITKLEDRERQGKDNII
jgi:hypothetical protein